MLIPTLDNRVAGAYRTVMLPLGEAPVQIPDHIRKCVAFVAYEKPSAERDRPIIATAFFISVPIPNTCASATYAVTAAHVLDQIAEMAHANRASHDIFLRINESGGGSQFIATQLGDWVRHPDASIDVAVFPASMILAGNQFDVVRYPFINFATDDVLAEHEVGVGDDLFVAGLFSKNPGSERNIPIIRSGTIAAIPEVSVVIERTGKSNLEMDAYLAECRSIGGLSGSPVFVYLGNIRKKQGELHIEENRPSYYLLGLMSGHYQDLDEGMRRERLNVGISFVVPATKILATLDLPEVQGQIQEMAAHLQASPSARFDDTVDHST